MRIRNRAPRLRLGLIFARYRIVLRKYFSRYQNSVKYISSNLRNEQQYGRQSIFESINLLSVRAQTRRVNLETDKNSVVPVPGGKKYRRTVCSGTALDEKIMKICVPHLLGDGFFAVNIGVPACA